MYTSTQAIDHKYIQTCTHRQTDEGKGPGPLPQGHIRTESQNVILPEIVTEQIMQLFTLGGSVGIQFGTFGGKS